MIRRLAEEYRYSRRSTMKRTARTSCHGTVAETRSLRGRDGSHSWSGTSASPSASATTEQSNHARCYRCCECDCKSSTSNTSRATKRARATARTMWYTVVFVLCAFPANAWTGSSHRRQCLYMYPYRQELTTIRTTGTLFLSPLPSSSSSSSSKPSSSEQSTAASPPPVSVSSSSTKKSAPPYKQRTNRGANHRYHGRHAPPPRANTRRTGTATTTTTTTTATAGRRSTSCAAIQFNQMLQDFIRRETAAAAATTTGRSKRQPRRRNDSPTAATTAAATTVPSVAQLAQDLLMERVHRAKQQQLASTTAIPSSSTIPSTTTTIPEYDYDTVSYNIVLQAWSRQHSMAAAAAADALLDQLLMDTSSSCQADSYSWAAVLHAYAKAGGKRAAAVRATALLQTMLTATTTSNSTTPTTILQTDVPFNAAMNAWAVSGEPHAGERAWAILQLLDQHPTARPSRISYNACIKAYAKAGQATQAQAVLEQMKLLARDNPALAPDKISYTSCINAWTTVAEPAAADALLRELELASEKNPGQWGLRPDVVAYTSVLAAFAKAKGQATQAAAVAVQLLDRMQQYADDKPNAAFLNTYVRVLLLVCVVVCRCCRMSMVALTRPGRCRSKHNFFPCLYTFSAGFTCWAKRLPRGLVKRQRKLPRVSWITCEKSFETGTTPFDRARLRIRRLYPSWHKQGLSLQRNERKRC